MTRISICLLILASFPTAILAQQDKLITHFMYDKMSVNPGETGIEEGICGTAIYRNQWGRVFGAPNSVALNVEANINQYFPGGVGINFYHDAIGFARQNSVLLNYSYPVVTEVGILGVGLGLGLFNYGMEPDWIPPTDDIDNALPIGYSATGMDFNFGVYWKGLSKYYGGLSFTHLNSPRLEKTISENGQTLTQAFQAGRHFYLMGGYTTDPIGPGKIDGNLIFRTDFVKTSTDINLRYLMRMNNLEYYGGLSFRTNESIPLMIGGSMNNFTVGYSYDITINKIADVSRGTHELMVKYCYYLPPPIKTPSKHPRWL